MPTQLISTPANLGYQFEPDCPPNHPAYRQLKVWLRANPTQQHYDPENISCQTTSPQDAPETIVIQHPWAYAPIYPVSIGRIVLTDRKSKRIEAFTFGGALQINSNFATTVCTFESPTPILALLETESVSSRLAAEVEVVLAEGRAAWDRLYVMDEFDQRLNHLPPFQLYLGCLDSVDSHLRSVPPGDELRQAVLHFIAQERNELKDKGLWPLEPVTLEELLYNAN